MSNRFNTLGDFTDLSVSACHKEALSSGGRLQALFHRLNILRSRCSENIWRRLGAEIARGCHFEGGVNLDFGWGAGRAGIIKLESGCRLSRGAVLHCYGGLIELGENVFLGPYTMIYGHGGVRIGKDSLIAGHCRIVSANHTVPRRDRHIRWEPDIPLPITIGEDVWLGAGVTVIGGVTIGDGCVVGAGAVVTKDLQPYSLAVGVPAQVVGTRE